MNRLEDKNLLIKSKFIVQIVCISKYTTYG